VPLQPLSQHSLLDEHAAPVGLQHSAAPHTPWQQLPLQQEVSATHAPPAATHAPASPSAGASGHGESVGAAESARASAAASPPPLPLLPLLPLSWLSPRRSSRSSKLQAWVSARLALHIAQNLTAHRMVPMLTDAAALGKVARPTMRRATQCPGLARRSRERAASMRASM
jgi:hypothetical protein